MGPSSPLRRAMDWLGPSTSTAHLGLREAGVAALSWRKISTSSPHGSRWRPRGSRPRQRAGIYCRGSRPITERRRGVRTRRRAMDLPGGPSAGLRALRLGYGSAFLRSGEARGTLGIVTERAGFLSPALFLGSVQRETPMAPTLSRHTGDLHDLGRL